MRFIYVSNFSEPSSLLVQRKQTGFSTNTSSEAKIAVFKVKQLRIGLEDKVCIIQEGRGKHWSETVCEFFHSSGITHKGDVFLYLQIFITLDGLMF